jgi:hypothetical protein
LLADPCWALAPRGEPHDHDARDVELFTEMTRDRNPIHYDAELAAKSPFGTLVVQGGVTTGLLNAVVAEDLPGPGTVFLETNWQFVGEPPVELRSGEIVLLPATTSIFLRAARALPRSVPRI